MDAIRTFFVRAKHWQVFALIVGLFVICNIIALRSSLPAEGEATGALMPFLLSVELCAIGYAIWSWSLGSFLNSAVRPELRLSTKLFRAAVFFPSVYLPLFDAVFYSLKPGLLFAILPLHFFAVFCIFYNLYFVSKSLVLAEKSAPVEFPNYIGTLFLVWFFPIGVWFTQPRINRLYAGTLNRQTA